MPSLEGQRRQAPAHPAGHTQRRASRCCWPSRPASVPMAAPGAGPGATAVGLMTHIITDRRCGEAGYWIDLESCRAAGLVSAALCGSMPQA
jgi:hypothetical protein